MLANLSKYLVVLCITCCVSNDRRLCYNVLCVSCYRRLCYIAWRRILADILLCYRPSGDQPTRLRFCTNTETAMQCYRPSGASRLVTSYPRSSICVPAPISASTISNISVFSTISIFSQSFFTILFMEMESMDSPKGCVYLGWVPFILNLQSFKLIEDAHVGWGLSQKSLGPKYFHRFSRWIIQFWWQFLFY